MALGHARRWLEVRYGVLAAIALVLITAGLVAQPALAASPGWRPFAAGTEEWMFAIAYGRNHDIPAGDRTDVSFGGLTLRHGRFLTASRQVAIEVAGCDVSGPQHGEAVGASVLWRRYFVLDHPTVLFWEAGGGLAYADLTVAELPLRLNFVLQAGVGVHVFFDDDAAFTLTLRFHHLSNGGRRDPNVGLNSSMLVVGVSRFF